MTLAAAGLGPALRHRACAGGRRAGDAGARAAARRAAAVGRHHAARHACAVRGGARASSTGCAVPAVLAIPGNHDIPLFNLAARLLWPYARYARAFGQELEPQFENRRRAGARAQHHPALAPRRRRGLAPRRSNAWRNVVKRAPAAQWRIVVVHQPVAVTRPQDAHNLLHGHDAAVRRWSAAGVDLVLGGHIHLPFVLPLQDLWADLPRPLWAVQAGTAVSARVRAEAGNSVNLIRIGAGSGTAGPADTRRPGRCRSSAGTTCRRHSASNVCRCIACRGAMTPDQAWRWPPGWARTRWRCSWRCCARCCCWWPWSPGSGMDRSCAARQPPSRSLRCCC